MKVSFQPILGAVLAALAALPADTSAAEPAAAPATVPAAAFFRFADMSDVRISPDGSAVAILVRNKAGRRQLAVMDTADLTKIKIVASFEEFDVAWAQWADAKSLV